MKNGLELEAPVTQEIGSAAAFAIRILAVSVGVWFIISAVRWW
ncbi:hypothetical protein ACMWRF_000448 [Enterobacter hormaechei]